MNDYKIRVTTEADGSGAKETAKGLKEVSDSAEIVKAKLKQAAQTNASYTAESDKVTKSAKESASVFKELFTEQEKQQESLAKQKKLQEELAAEQKKQQEAQALAALAAQNAAAATDRWAISKTQAIAALKKLKHEIPGLSYAIDLLKNPYAAAAAAIATFIIAIQKQINKQNELATSSQALGDAIDKARERMSRQKGSYDDLTNSAEDYRQKLRQLTDESMGLDASVTDKLAELGRNSAMASRVDQRNLAASETDIDLKVERKQITPTQGEAAKRKLRAEYEQRQTKREQDLIASRATILGQASEAKRQAALAAEQEIPKAEAEAKRAADVAAKNKAALPGARASLEEQVKRKDKQIQEAELKAAKMAVGSGWPGAPGADPSRVLIDRVFNSDEDITKQQDRVRYLQNQRRIYQTRLEELDSRQQRLDTEAKTKAENVRSLQDVSVSARRSSLSYSTQAQTTGEELRSSRIESNQINVAAAREERSKQEIDEIRRTEALEDARHKALMEWIKGSGKRAASIKGQLEAEAGR